MALIIFVRAWLLSYLPRTYVRVDDLDTGGWFLCTPPEAAAHMDAATEEAGEAARRPRWHAGGLAVGRQCFTVVRMSPRRYAAQLVQEAR